MRYHDDGIENNHPNRHDTAARFRRTLVPCLLMACVWVFAACAHQPNKNPDTSFFDGVLSIYQEPLDHLSAVRRGVCPMHPSCSVYSRQAIDKHGFALGWAMSMDRLLRCGRDELKRAPVIFVNGQWKYFDPLSANDRWWHLADGEEAVSDVGTRHPAE